MDTFAAIVTIIAFTYFTVSLFIAHHIYKHFKNRQADSGGGLMGGLGGIVPGQGANPMQGGRAAMDDRVQQPERAVAPDRRFNAFQGQGVAIG